MKRLVPAFLLVTASCGDLSTDPASPSAAMARASASPPPATAASPGAAEMQAATAAAHACPRFEDADWTFIRYLSEYNAEAPECFSTERSGDVRVVDEHVVRRPEWIDVEDPDWDFFYRVQIGEREGKPTFYTVLGTDNYYTVPPWTEVDRKAVRAVVLDDSVAVVWRTAGYPANAMKAYRVTPRWVLMRTPAVSWVTGYRWVAVRVPDCVGTPVFSRRGTCSDWIFPAYTGVRDGYAYALFLRRDQRRTYAYNVLPHDDNGWSAEAVTEIVFAR